MTKMEKFMSELEKLKTPDNEKVVGKLMEGVTLIADEYRRRKASENAAKLEAEGFAKLDKHRTASGLSTKAFVEGVGKTILESRHPEEIKEKMMESLAKYGRYLTESNGCIFSLEPLTDEGKQILTDNSITPEERNNKLINLCQKNDGHKYGDAAAARKLGVEDTIKNGFVSEQGIKYKPGTVLLNKDNEKLVVFGPKDNSIPVLPYILHYADATGTAANKVVESVDEPPAVSTDERRNIPHPHRDTPRVPGRPINRHKG